MPGRNGIPVRGQIIRVLSAATAFQTVRTAARLDFDVSGVPSPWSLTLSPSAHAPQEARSAPCATTLTSPGPRQTGKHLADQ